MSDPNEIVNGLDRQQREAVVAEMGAIISEVSASGLGFEEIKPRLEEKIRLLGLEEESVVQAFLDGAERSFTKGSKSK